MQCGQQERPQLCRIGDMRIEESDDGDDEVQTREEATVYVKVLDLFVTVMLLEETPAVLSLGKLCEDHGYTYHWTSGQKPHLTKNGKRIYCKISNYVPFVVPGLSTSPSTTPTPTSSSSSLQDSVISTENPAAERSEIMSEEPPGNASCGSAATENTHKNEDEESRSELLQDVPEWLQDFKDNLVDKNAHPHQYSSSSSRELPMESRAKVVPGPGKHSIHTHFPKHRNCDICFRTKITRASCRRRTGTVVPKAENFSDVIPADQKVLSEGCESRHNHRYAVVVKDLATQETQKSLQNFLKPTRKPKVIYTDNSLEIGKSCEE